MKHQGVIVTATVLFGGAMEKLGAPQRRWARANVITDAFRRLMDDATDEAGDVVIALVPAGDGQEALDRLDAPMALTAEQVTWLAQMLAHVDVHDMGELHGPHAQRLYRRIRLLAGC